MALMPTYPRNAAPPAPFEARPLDVGKTPWRAQLALGLNAQEEAQGEGARGEGCPVPEAKRQAGMADATCSVEGIS